MTKQSNNTPNDSLQYLHVHDWGRWQSYRHDRGHPPWIKVHRRLMRNPNWVALTDAQKGQLVSIWMLAADRNGVVPSSPALIKRLCCLEQEPELSTLIELGFLDARMTPRRKAERRQLVAPETETEAETEAETESIDASPPAQPQERGQPRKKGERGHRLPDDWMPNAKGQAFAAERFGDEGAREEYESFRDYWLAKPGKDGRKLDWDRTWMNWCRNSRRNGNGMKSFTGNGHGRPKTLKERTADALQRLGSGSLGETIDLGLPKLGPD